MEEESLILFFIFMFLVLSVMISVFVDTFQLPFIHFSATAIVLGLIFGGLMRLFYPGSDWSDVQFGDKIFFHAVLPIIVFATGYSLDVKTFFANLKSISILGIFGTVFLWIGLGLSAMALRDMGLARDLSDMECLILAAVLASTDTIAVVALLEPEASPVLYSVLAGEGMVNDGISVVLYRAVTDVAEDNDTDEGLSMHLIGQLAVQFLRVLSLSLLLGIAVGLLSALCAKWSRQKPPSDVETCYIYIWGLIAYFAAEATDTSGIISIFVCGITMSQYTVRNISETAAFTSFHSLNALSYTLQALVFTVLGFFTWTYLGNDFVFSDIDGAESDVYLAIGMFISIAVCRGLLLPWMLYIGNFGKSGSERMNWRQQLAAWYGGLVRGIIAFALSQSISSENKDGMITTTFIVVIFTTIVGGCLTKPIFGCFKVPTSSDEAAEMRSVEASPAILSPTGEEFPDLGASGASFEFQELRRKNTLSHIRCSTRAVPTLASSLVIRTDVPFSPLRTSPPPPDNLTELKPSKFQEIIKVIDKKVMQPLFGGPPPSSTPQFTTSTRGSHPMATEQTGLLHSFPQVPPGTNPFTFTETETTTRDRDGSF